jgi:hypothetical protein
MGEFKGIQNTNGRPKGIQNRNTKQARESFNLLLANNINKIQNDIDLLKPFERVKVILDLAKFVIPQLKAVEITEVEKVNFQPIIIEFKK